MFENNELTERAKLMSSEIRKFFGDRVTDFCIFGLLNESGHREFNISFKAYNYFPVYFSYENGNISFSIIYGEYGRSPCFQLNNSQHLWENLDFDQMLSELQSELELRIPDKYLESKGWKVRQGKIYGK